MRDRFQPADGYEDGLVDQIAMVFVWMARLERYQHGVIESQFEALDEPGRFAAPRWAVPLGATPQEPDGLEPVLGLLAELDQLDEDTPIGEMEVEMVLLALPVDARGEWPGVPPGREPPDRTGWTAKSLRARIDGAAETAGVEPAEMLRATRDELITLRAHARRTRAQARRDRAAELDTRRRRERAERTAMLPRPEVLEQLMRYRAHLERSLERLVKLLESAQRARAGTLPPPVRVEVSVE
jgi:hypothetical protein